MVVGGWGRSEGLWPGVKRVRKNLGSPGANFGSTH